MSNQKTTGRFVISKWKKSFKGKQMEQVVYKEKIGNKLVSTTRHEVVS